MCYEIRMCSCAIQWTCSLCTFVLFIAFVFRNICDPNIRILALTSIPYHKSDLKCNIIEVLCPNVHSVQHSLAPFHTDLQVNKYMWTPEPDIHPNSIHWWARRSTTFSCTEGLCKTGTGQRDTDMKSLVLQLFLSLPHLPKC